MLGSNLGRRSTPQARPSSVSRCRLTSCRLPAQVAANLRVEITQALVVAEQDRSSFRHLPEEAIEPLGHNGTPVARAMR